MKLYNKTAIKILKDIGIKEVPKSILRSLWFSPMVLYWGLRDFLKTKEGINAVFEGYAEAYREHQDKSRDSSKFK